VRKNGAPVQRNRSGRITVTCAGCGVTFESIRSQMERRGGPLQKFHDRQCWLDYRAAKKLTPRTKHLKQKYGMTEADYRALFEAQGGVCAICRCLPDGVDLTLLVVDHDHETGRVRGLLCTTCNLGLERFKDDPKLLRAAALYLDGLEDWSE
jgi:Recombination endonuclease VII